MHNKPQFRNPLSRSISHVATLVLTIVFVLALIPIFTQSAHAQTFNVIYNFTGGADGGNPQAGLTMDSAGNLYGTTSGGGSAGDGTIFRLQHSSSGWLRHTLYSFAGGSDGAVPDGPVAIARDGTFYGVTFAGGMPCYWGTCGTVFHVAPPPSAPKSMSTPWTETVIHRFSGGSDGGFPQGDLIFDQSGNIYGTTLIGGVVYRLEPSTLGWTENILYSLVVEIHGGVISDKSGNLYGVADGGEHGHGAVFKLSRQGGVWTEETLYSFTGGDDGTGPDAGLVFDESGNLYGTTFRNGSRGGGTVFELMPANGGWIFNTIYSFSCGQDNYCNGPEAELTIDAAGSLYGTTYEDGAFGFGSVFKLTPSDAGWIYTDLHDFTGGTDGSLPISNVVLDASGNLYGTTSRGGDSENCSGWGWCGTVWEITP